MSQDQPNIGGRPPSPKTVEGRFNEIVNDIQKMIALSRRKTEEQIKLIAKEQTKMSKDGRLTLSDMSMIAELYAKLPASITSLVAPLAKAMNDLKSANKGAEGEGDTVEDWKDSLK